MPIAIAKGLQAVTLALGHVFNAGAGAAQAQETTPTNAADICVADVWKDIIADKRAEGGGVVHMGIDQMNAIIDNCEDETGVEADNSVPPAGTTGVTIIVAPPPAP